MAQRRRASAPGRSSGARPCATRSVPTLTLTGVQFTFLIGGTVLVEKLFGLPGLGNMAIDAVINRDLPLIQGIDPDLRGASSSPSTSWRRHPQRAPQPEAAAL